MGRAPAFWTAENTSLIKEKFVAVSVSNIEQDRQDAVGRFFREAGIEFPVAGGSQWCVTSSGKVLLGNNHYGLGFDVKKALEKWNALPAAERAPGAVKIDEISEVDAALQMPSPPTKGLIIKVYYRALMRDGDRLRYVTGKDLWHDEFGLKTEENTERRNPGLITTPQAQPDHMWLTEAEWKSLLPDVPRKGYKFPMPSKIMERFIRWHLNPLSVYGETSAIAPESVRAGELTLTVEDLSASSVRLRLDGSAKLGSEPPQAVADGACACVDKWGYEPRVLGFLEYEPRSRVITRFDVVALGNHFGRLGIADSAARIGLQPLGISFEMVSGESPADRIPPGRLRSSKDYFK